MSSDRLDSSSRFPTLSIRGSQETEGTGSRLWLGVVLSLLVVLWVTALAGGLGTWFTPDFEAGTPLVSRLYLAYVGFLPALIFVLVVAHLTLVKRRSVSAEPNIHVGTADPDEQVSSTCHLRHLSGWSLILLAMLTLVAATTANPAGAAEVAGIELTKPLWRLWFLHQLENWIGIQGLFWAPVVLFLLLAALPFLDRSPEKPPARRRRVMKSALVVVRDWAVPRRLGSATLIVAFYGPASHFG